MQLQAGNQTKKFLLNIFDHRNLRLRSRCINQHTFAEPPNKEPANKQNPSCRTICGRGLRLPNLYSGITFTC